MTHGSSNARMEMHREPSSLCLSLVLDPARNSRTRTKDEDDCNKRFSVHTHEFFQTRPATFDAKRRVVQLALACFVFLLSVGSGMTQAAPADTQLPANWIVLEANAATRDGNRLVWEFELTRPWNYYVQAIHDGAATTLAATVEVAGQRFQERLNKSFVIEAGTVSQFKRPAALERAGRHTLSLESDAPLKQVRLIPEHPSLLGSGKYDAQWRAMHETPGKQATLKWFKQARFGMFIHWGLYSQAGGIWQGKRIEDSPYPGPRVAEWLMSTFRIPRAEYAELGKTFNPDKSFAANIAKLARDTGMKYVVITSKHHDGFALFDSACSPFDVTDATPYQGDLIKELYEACRAEGLEFGAYYSHGNDWHDGADGNHARVKKRNDALGIPTRPQGKNTWDPSPDTFEEYLERKASPQIAELIKLLPDLRLIWFDGEGNITEEQAFRFYQLIYDLNPGIIVNRRVGYGLGDYEDAGDNVIPSASAEIRKHWETCGTANNSWGYKAYDHDWKSTQELLYYFIDIASKGGNYLLNVGPDGQGRVPEACVRNLREMGTWLKVNGAAIYGTTRWKIPHEGQPETLLRGTGQRAKTGFSREFSTEDFWFTTRDDKVYVMSLVPSGAAVRIRSLNTSEATVAGVRLLGSSRNIPWQQTASALELDFAGVETGTNGFAVEVTVK